MKQASSSFPGSATSASNTEVQRLDQALNNANAALRQVVSGASSGLDAVLHARREQRQAAHVEHGHAAVAWLRTDGAVARLEPPVHQPRFPEPTEVEPVRSAAQSAPSADAWQPFLKHLEGRDDALIRLIERLASGPSREAGTTTDRLARLESQIAQLDRLAAVLLDLTQSHPNDHAPKRS